MKTYKIRRFQNGRNKDGEPFINYSLTIPSPIAEKLPDDMQFACELTDEGILFRPADQVEDQVALPAWAKPEQKNGDGPSKPAAKRSRPKAKPAS